LVKLRRELWAAKLENETLRRAAAYFAAENVLNTVYDIWKMSGIPVAWRESVTSCASAEAFGDTRDPHWRLWIGRWWRMSDSMVEGTSDGDRDERGAGPGPRRIVIVLAALLVVAVAGAGWIWWMNRGDDLAVGSRHRVTVTVKEVAANDCWNNISPARVGDHTWDTDAHAPETWGFGEVSGWLEVTAEPAPGTTATFTADRGGSVDFQGGQTGTYFSDLTCLVGP
jgi:hypothetical protein